jgi:hypothetical protein
MEKIRKEVDAWPEIFLVVMILIKEAQEYRSPQEGSATWDFHSQHEECLPPESFLVLPATADGSGIDDAF